jgi:hypothetical protein
MKQRDDASSAANERVSARMSAARFQGRERVFHQIGGPQNVADVKCRRRARARGGDRDSCEQMDGPALTRSREPRNSLLRWSMPTERGRRYNFQKSLFRQSKILHELSWRICALPITPLSQLRKIALRLQSNMPRFDHF